MKTWCCGACFTQVSEQWDRCGCGSPRPSKPDWVEAPTNPDECSAVPLEVVRRLNANGPKGHRVIALAALHVAHQTPDTFRRLEQAVEAMDTL